MRAQQQRPARHMRVGDMLQGDALYPSGQAGQPLGMWTKRLCRRARAQVSTAPVGLHNSKLAHLIWIGGLLEMKDDLVRTFHCSSRSSAAPLCSKQQTQPGAQQPAEQMTLQVCATQPVHRQWWYLYKPRAGAVCHPDPAMCA
jgi:hypothetical protein